MGRSEGLKDKKMRAAEYEIATSTFSRFPMTKRLICKCQTLIPLSAKAFSSNMCGKNNSFLPGNQLS
ncbi:MAG: hypothetical protein WAW45_03120 [Atribacterota bacterium]